MEAMVRDKLDVLDASLRSTRYSRIMEWFGHSASDREHHESVLVLRRLSDIYGGQGLYIFVHYSI